MVKKEVNGMSGEACEVSGVYTCVHISHGEITISTGEIFPKCPVGEHETVWWLRGKKGE
jgi:hypothetical protein